MSLIIFPNGKQILDHYQGIPKGYRVHHVEMFQGMRRTYIAESRWQHFCQFFLNLFVKAGDWAVDTHTNRSTNTSNN